MRKTVLLYGLAAGVLAVAFMLATLPYIGDARYQIADVLGYTSIVLSALVVFFGIRSYRHSLYGGRLTFWRALAVGVLITLVSCVIQVVAFEWIYFKAMPSFGDKFVLCMVERARDAGASDAEILRTADRATDLKKLYDQPLANAALTFATSFPIGLVVAVVSALILRTRRRPQPINPSHGDDALA